MASHQYKKTPNSKTFGRFCLEQLLLEMIFIWSFRQEHNEQSFENSSILNFKQEKVAGV